MAKIEEINDYLDPNLEKVLEDTVNRVSLGNNIDKSTLYRDFKRVVGRRYKTWERVPDKSVEQD